MSPTPSPPFGAGADRSVSVVFSVLVLRSVTAGSTGPREVSGVSVNTNLLRRVPPVLPDTPPGQTRSPGHMLDHRCLHSLSRAVAERCREHPVGREQQRLHTQPEDRCRRRLLMDPPPPRLHKRDDDEQNAHHDLAVRAEHRVEETLHSRMMSQRRRRSASGTRPASLRIAEAAWRDAARRGGWDSTPRSLNALQPRAGRRGRASAHVMTTTGRVMFGRGRLRVC